MREARIILPTIGNDGSDLTDCHAALQSTLCATFGGFTVTQGQGGWRDGSTVYMDSVAVYDVASDATEENRAKLESLALFYGHMASQHCVYVRHAAGDVVMVDCRAMVTA